MEMPLVSVIVNCHNGQKYLSECIDSIINQTYENWELIFWDNVSSDKSKEILENYSDSRIKYFLSKKLTKLYKARNLAIEKATGDYITFLDTDDLWTTDKLEKQVDFLKRNKEAKIIYTNYFVLQENTKRKYIQHKIDLPSGLITQKLIDYYSIGILTVFIDRSIFKNFKFKNDYNIIGDFDFFINLSQKIKIFCIQEPLAFYRIHNSNFSNKKNVDYVEELEKWINDNDKTFSDKGYSLQKQKILLLKLKIKSFFKKFFSF